MSGSVAAAVKVNSNPSLVDLFPIGDSTGGLLISLTTMVIVLASLNGEEALSVTRSVTALVLGPCDSPGVQVKTPLLALMLAPAGAPGSRLNVSACAGKSESVAPAVKVNRPPSFTTWLAIGASAGAVFTSPTVIMMVCESLRLGDPLSVT